MCDDNDLEGVRLWFYGGTPPLNDTAADEHEAHASTDQAWTWPTSSPQPVTDNSRELSAA